MDVSFKVFTGTNTGRCVQLFGQKANLAFCGKGNVHKMPAIRAAMDEAL
ncbi:MAG: hypothetical protein LBB16_00290 [Puniceicoccales bacterium]|jgi:hypothetical protein|nr:hypothetical protein [Puniceicoccales bacterium]